MRATEHNRLVDIGASNPYRADSHFTVGAAQSSKPPRIFTGTRRRVRLEDFSSQFSAFCGEAESDWAHKMFKGSPIPSTSKESGLPRRLSDEVEITLLVKNIMMLAPPSLERTSRIIAQRVNWLVLQPPPLSGVHHNVTPEYHE